MFFVLHNLKPVKLEVTVVEGEHGGTARMCL
jgi:hypothetical protein